MTYVRDPIRVTDVFCIFPAKSEEEEERIQKHNPEVQHKRAKKYNNGIVERYRVLFLCSFSKKMPMAV